MNKLEEQKELKHYRAIAGLGKNFDFYSEIKAMGELVA